MTITKTSGRKVLALSIDTEARLEAWCTMDDLGSHPHVKLTLKSGNVERVMESLQGAFYGFLAARECGGFDLTYDYPSPEGLREMAEALMAKQAEKVAS